LRAYLWVFVAVVIWGLEYPLMKRCSQTIGVLPTGAAMFSLAALLLGLTLLAQRRKGPAATPGAPKRVPYGPLVLIGALSIGVNLLGLWGIELTSVPNSSTLARSDALFSLFLSALVFREKIAAWAFLFVPVMLGGICLLTGILSGPIALGNPGDYLMLGSAFCLALNAFVIKRAVQQASSALVGLFNAAIAGGFFAVAAFAVRDDSVGRLAASQSVWPALGALGFLSYLFYLSYNTALRTIPVWEVRLLCLLVPVVATLSAWVGLNEKPTLLNWLGMTLISGGAAGIIVARRANGTRNSEN